jgi:YidC/Oxa1 family membrane protein insertase
MSPYALLDPTVRLADAFVSAVSHLLTWPGGGWSVVVSVVLLTVAVRAALLPLALRALRGERARASLLPEVEQIRRRRAGDPARAAREVSEAYRAAGVSQLAGIGPSLLQLPFLATLYRVVVVPTVGGHPNVVATASVLGGPLSAHWPVLLSGAGLLSTSGLCLALVLVALVVTASVASAQAGSRSAGRLGRLLPFATVGFAVLAPVGVGFYLVASTAWSAAERALLPRFA